MPPTSWTRADLAALDTADELASFRNEFRLPADLIYLDGNSLGPLPAQAAARVAQVVEQQWGEGLIRSWNTAGWIDWPVTLGAKIARLIGAAPGSTRVADSTSVNLFKLLAGALALRPGRPVILTEAGNFPTDLYIAQGLAALLDRGHRVVQAAPDQITARLDNSVAVLLLTHVNYRTGRLHDMQALTQQAHAAGALVIWDLAHSAGAMPLDLAGCDADFAIGCGYKFLNGGPGAPAFLMVAPRHADSFTPGLTGWFGHAAPFAFEAEFRPAKGADRALVGTPGIIGMAALECGLDVALAADLHEVRAKSLRMSSILMDLVDQLCPGHFGLLTPKDETLRGSQVSLTHDAAYPIMQALIARVVIGDVRQPNILRFGLTPLYLRFTDLWDAAVILADIMHNATWQRPEFQTRQKVI